MSSSLKHLLILVGILCLSLSFSVKGVYILLSLEWGGSLFFFRAYIYTFNSVFIKKISTFVRHFIITARLLLNWKKDTNKEFNCVMVLVMWLRSTLKFYLFLISITQWTHLRRFAIDSTSKILVESSWKLHRFWKANPCGNYDIDSTWIFRRGFDFQNRRNIDEFSTWIFLCCFDVKSM